MVDVPVTDQVPAVRVFGETPADRFLGVVREEVIHALSGRHRGRNRAVLEVKDVFNDGEFRGGHHARRSARGD